MMFGKATGTKKFDNSYSYKKDYSKKDIIGDSTIVCDCI